MALFLYPTPTPVLPALNGFSIKKAPVFASGVDEAVSGREVTMALQSYPLWEFELTYEILRSQTQNQVADTRLSPYLELERLMLVHLACDGSYGRFYYDDLSDNSRTGQFIAIADGDSTVYRAYRYVDGTRWREPVGGINDTQAINVYFDDALQSSSIWSVSDDKQSFVFDTAPAADVVITADYYYYYLCQFLDDQVDFEQFLSNRWLAKSLKFRSVKGTFNEVQTPGPPIVDTELNFYSSSFSAYCYPAPDELFFQLGGVIAEPNEVFSGTISIGINSGPMGAVLSGTTSQTAVDGDAFWDVTMLSVSLPGTYTFIASATGLTSAISDAVEIALSDNTICLDPPIFLLTPQLGAITASRYMLAAIVFHQYTTFSFRLTDTLPNFSSTCNILIGNSNIQLGGTALSRLSFTLPTAPADGMYQMIVSADALTGVIQIVVNGTLVTDGTSFFGGAFFFTPTDAYVQLSTSGNSGSDGIFGDVYFTTTAGFFDLTNPTNLDKLWDSGLGQAVDLSGDPSVVTGSNPIVYAHGDPTTYLTDYGSIEVFDVVSGLTEPFDPGSFSYASHGYA